MADIDRIAWLSEEIDHEGIGPMATDHPPLDETHHYERRRLVGWEFLDRTDDDPPVAWDVVVELDTLRVGDVVSEAS